VVFLEYAIANRMKTLKGSAIREIFKMAGKPGVISFAGGVPAPELFPNEELAQISADILRKEPELALQYGITEGYMPLRKAVKQRLLEKENIGKDFDETIIVSGAQQGIEHAIKILINPGDGVVVEQPSFIGTLNALRSYEADLYSVPVQEDGMDLDRLEDLIRKHPHIKMIYTIPTFQNPTGVSMSIEKRKTLYELACKNNLIILEDNPYGELSFDDEKLPTIKSLDTEGIVIYVGTFSKILSPGLRVGYVCAHQDLVGRITVNKQISDVHTSMLPQMMAYEFMTRYPMDDYIQKMRALYKHRCNFMIEKMDEHFPERCSHTNPRGGLFIWCDLNGDFDTVEVARECAKDLVVFVPGSTFMVDMEKKSSGFRLNYSNMGDEAIEKGIRILGRSLTKCIGK
jgi:2-aminoadipate transaminase